MSLHSLPTPSPVLRLGPGFRPPLFLHPGPSAKVSASLAERPNHLPPQGSGRLSASLSQSPPLHPTRGSPVWPHSYLLSCGLHTCPGFPSPKHTLLCAFCLTSPSRRPSSLPSSPFPVCSEPGRLHPPLHPKAPGSRAPLPFPLSCYPGFLRLSPRQSSLPLVPPSHLPAPSLPNFYITVYLACRAPAPPCRAPPGAGGGRRRDRERPGGSRTGPCRRDSPASGSAPRPAPGPKPTLPHPPRTEREWPCCAAPLGWGGGHWASGAGGGTRRNVVGCRGPGASPSPLWGVRSL